MESSSSKADLFIHRLLEGTLSADEGVQYLAILKTDQAELERLVLHVDFDSDLRELSFSDNRQMSRASAHEFEPFVLPDDRFFTDLVRLEKEARPLISPRPKPTEAPRRNEKADRAFQKHKKTSRFRPRYFILSFFLVSLFLAGIYFEFFHKATSSHDNIHDVAELVDIVRADWENDDLKIGCRLEPGSLKLRSGVARLRFGNRTEVIIEGPTELLLKKRDRVFCPQGRLSVYVPPHVKGFEVATPTMTVVDLGTAFSMQIEKERTDVHVLQGKVELRPSAKNGMLLVENKAVSTDPNGLKTIEVDPKTFYSEEKLRIHKEYYFEQRQPVWQERDDLLANDPALVFQLFPEKMTLGKTRGSRPDKTALNIRGKNDRVDVPVSRTFQRLTLLATVRPESMRHVCHTLLMDNDVYRRPGAFLWQLNNSGAVQFHVNENGAVRRYDAPSVIARKDWNTWFSLALVADDKEKTIKHYCDGKMVASVPWNPSTPLELGGATLGNEAGGEKKSFLTFFEGQIEEFRIYDRVYSSEEIKRLYDDSR